MNVDFSAGILSLDGEPMLAAPDKPWTIGRMAADCLLAPQPSGALSVSQVSERYALALRVAGGGEVDITAPEATMIQEAVAANAAPIAAAQVIAATNGRCASL